MNVWCCQLPAHNCGKVAFYTVYFIRALSEMPASGRVDQFIKPSANDGVDGARDVHNSFKATLDHGAHLRRLSDGSNRRKATVADRDRERLKWADKPGLSSRADLP